MSVREDHDFIEDYLTWMKGSTIRFDSLHVYNFGYERNLPIPSIALTPESKLKLNLQTSGMQTPSRSSIVIIGEKYVGRFQEIMTIIDRIHEDTQALPFVIFVQTDDEVLMGTPTSHVSPSLVWKVKPLMGIFKKNFNFCV